MNRNYTFFHVSGHSGSKKFNTSSSKNSGSVRLNVSFEGGGGAELCSGQIAQPQHHQQYLVEESVDLFPTKTGNTCHSPVQRRSVVVPHQRSSFSAGSTNRPVNLPCTSPNGALIKSNGLSRRTSFRSPTASSGGGGESKNVPIPKIDVVLRGQEPKLEKTTTHSELKFRKKSIFVGRKTHFLTFSKVQKTFFDISKIEKIHFCTKKMFLKL